MATHIFYYHFSWKRKCNFEFEGVIMAGFSLDDAFELLQGVVSTTPATYSAATGVETIANNQRNGTHNLTDFFILFF